MVCQIERRAGEQCAERDHCNGVTELGGDSDVDERRAEDEKDFLNVDQFAQGLNQVLHVYFLPALRPQD